LQFNAIASPIPGDYVNNASATAVDAPVTPSGPTAKVTVTAPAPLCGNGTPDPGEACDDGNVIDGDGCDSNCTPTGCGNGIVTGGEVCDDHNLVDGDGCDSNCTNTGCGNGIVTGGEQCDDGNTIDGDGCSATCQVEVFCGNGRVDPGETCDPPGGALLPNGNPCRADCTFCGDAIVNGPPGTETCDDANADDRDSCQNDCLGRFRRDPGTITFHGTSRPNDRLKVNGVVVTRLPVSTEGLTITVRLSNANGVVYEATLDGGDLVAKGRQLKFRDRNAASAVEGGIGIFRVSPHRTDGYRVKVEAYGDLSAATLADMTIEILFGLETYQNSATWMSTPKGWRLVDHEG
jgi:cysteine-rich repeat protein